MVKCLCQNNFQLRVQKIDVRPLAVVVDRIVNHSRSPQSNCELFGGGF